jgi:hypothetical protein
LQSQIKPYAASFSPRNPDSVLRDSITDGQGASVWWAQLAIWPGPEPGSPRSLEKLVTIDPTDQLVIVASPNYLNAIVEDLKHAVRRLQFPESLIIVSAGAKRLDGLQPPILPCNARLQGAFGGSRHSLNIRIARWILSETRHSPISMSTIRTRLEALLEEQPPLKLYERIPMSDAGVCDYICSELRQSPKAAKTPLLRRLRDSGHACEQKRFSRLYREVKGH